MRYFKINIYCLKKKLSTTPAMIGAFRKAKALGQPGSARDKLWQQR